MRTLADIIWVERRFRRSVRIDADMGDSTALDGFVCPPSIVDAMLSMGRQFAETGHGAFTWTGPYGSGKSSLAVMLAALLGSNEEMRGKARKAIGIEAANRIVSLMGAVEGGWTVLPIIGRRGDPEKAITDALEVAYTKEHNFRFTQSDVSSRIIEAVHSVPGTGLLLLVDEMGKFLDHAALGGSDVYLFQQLAETANRSNQRFVVIGILHQAFDDYANKLTREARDEWLKIQGRFVDIPINVAGEEQVSLIARAIQRSVPPPDSLVPEGIANAIRRNRPGTATSLGNELASCWPLHPVVASLLGPMSRRRFGQNQRSVFGFLNSAEPFGFQDFLRSSPEDTVVEYRPVRLWDYLRANLESSILASPDGHRWSLAVDAIERCEASGGDVEHLELIKTIALIDLFKERSGLFPTMEVLSLSLPKIDIENLEAMLEQLRKWSVVIFKKHLGAYAIYAGSDFDIDAAVDQAIAQMTGVDFNRLRSVASLQPLLAKRHYHETGVLRWFEVDIAPLSEGEDLVRKYQAKNGADGLFLLLVGMENEPESKAQRLWKAAVDAVGDTPVAVGWTRNSISIPGLASELLALETVRSERTELNGDSVARREVGARITRAAAELEEQARQAFLSADWLARTGPGDHGLLKMSGRTGLAGLNAIASQMASARFSNAPKIFNELLNRLKPSSNAIAAQKILLKAMVEKPMEPRVGIEGYPAEGGLFASLLEVTGLHRATKDGKGYGFHEPAEDDPARLGPMWKSAEHLFRKAGIGGADIRRLYDLWQAPPFGVRDGLLPIFAMAFILSKLERLAVYLDGTFQHKLTSLLIDRLTQDPASVRLRWSNVSDFHNKVLNGIAEVIAKQRGDTAGSVLSEPLDCARSLVGMVMGLKPWALKTTDLSETAIKVRNLAKMAHDPNKFLLDDLPYMFGVKGETDIDAEKVVDAVREGLAELVAAYPRMLSELAAVMLRELRVRAADPEELAELHLRAETVKGLTGNYRLDAFATRLAVYSGVAEEIEGIASLAANRPPRDWVDRDINQTRVELASLAQDFLKAEALAHVKGRSDRRTHMAIYTSDPDRPTPLAPDFSVGANQRAEVDRLVELLFEVLTKGRVERDVALAAVAELGSRLTEASVEDLNQPVRQKRRQRA
ncbi:MAG: ATP-binding protein [Magnetococcales bacterium]|nr:ATP-binding protein [Magnetococcales bacterium]